MGPVVNGKYPPSGNEREDLESHKCGQQMPPTGRHVLLQLPGKERECKLVAKWRLAIDQEES